MHNKFGNFHKKEITIAKNAKRTLHIALPLIILQLAAITAYIAKALPLDPKYVLFYCVSWLEYPAMSLLLSVIGALLFDLIERYETKSGGC